MRFVFSAMRARVIHMSWPKAGICGTPDRTKAKLFGKQRVLDGSGAGRQAEVTSQHRVFQIPGGYEARIALSTGLGNQTLTAILAKMKR